MPSNPLQNLPQGWEVKTLGEIAEISSGGTPSRSNKDYWENGTIAWVKIADMKNKYLRNTAEKITELGLKNSSAKIFPKGTLLYSVFATLGRTCILDIEATTNQAIAGINPKDSNINTLYLMYFLQSIEKLVCNMGRGATQNNINLSILKQIKIPLPPLATQKLIVEKLENAFAHIDEAVHHLKAVQTNIPRLKSSLLHCAFSGKLTESQNPSHEVQTLKKRVVGEEGETSPFKPPHPLIKEEIPQGWEVKTLGEVCEIVTGSTPSKNNAEYYGDDFPFYKPTDLNNGYYVETASDNISLKGFEISRQLPSGSVLVTCIGATIGKTGLIRNTGICNQQINAILPSREFISEFIYFYCISPKVQNFIKTNASSTTLPILNKANFSKLPIPLPPLETQKQIVQILESKFAHLEKLAQFVSESLENLQRLKSSLLNQAFKGELIC